MFTVTRDKVLTATVAAGIVAATLAVYWQVHRFGFLNYDDNVYVTENPYVAQGVTWRGIVAAFTQPQNAGWAPVSTLTHMIDVDLFGLDPGPPHVINLLFHCGNTVLVFLLLRAMTGSLWCSAFVAALFALHPLHVEPVAWISSRKDMLSMHFLLMTLKYYEQHVKRPARKHYLLAVFHFIPALLAKPIVVTLPVLMLLLDYWPLRRLAGASPILAEMKQAALRLLREKIPFFILSAVVCVITVVVQRSGGAVRSLDEYSLYERLGNAIVSYVTYIGVTFWPVGLAPYYPHPGALPVVAVLGALALLLLITALVLVRIRKSPYLAVGWGWWIVALLPVIGIVQIGSFARADRFTYLPHAGLFIMVAWGVAELSQRWPLRRPLLAVGAAAALVPLAVVSHVQAGYWRDTITLFTHTMEVTHDNAVAENNLGVTLMKQSGTPEGQPHDLARAEAHLRDAVRIAPAFVDAHNNLGIALLLQGKDGSVEQFEQALKLKPDDANALVNVGNARLSAGDVDEAIARYQRAIAVAAANVEAHYNLGIALSRKGDASGAVEQYRAAVALQPDNASLYASLANGLLLMGQSAKALVAAAQAVQLDRDNADAQYNLGVASHQLGQTGAAIAAFRKAIDLAPDFAMAHYNLAAVLANQGDTDEAIRHYAEALRLDPSNRGAQQALQALQNESKPESDAPATP